MNIKLTVYLTAILAVAIVVVVFVVNPRNNHNISGEQISEKRVFKIGTSGIDKISIQNGHGSFTVEQGAPGKWVIVSPVNTNADASTINSIVSGIKTLNYEKNIGAGPLTGFGLSPASITATAVSSDKKVYTLKIGDKTPIGEYYYANAVNGYKGIFTVTGWIRNELDNTLFQLRDKAVLSLPRNDITGISFTKGTRAVYTLKQEKNVWTFTKPSYNRIQVPLLNDMFFKLTNLTASDIIDNATDLKSMGLEKPSGVIRIVTMNNRQYSIKIGKDAAGDNVYAMISGQPAVYAVNKGILSTFDKTVDTMIDKKLLIQDRGAVSSIQIEWKGKHTVLSKGNYTNWSKDGSPFTDVAGINKLLDTLTSLNASGFVDNKGLLKHAAITFTVIGTMQPTTTTISIGDKSNGIIYVMTSIDPRSTVIDAGSADAIKSCIKRIYK